MHDTAASWNAELAVTRGVGILASRVQIIEAERVTHFMRDNCVSLTIWVYAIIVRLTVTASVDLGDGIDEMVMVESPFFGGPIRACAVVGVLLFSLFSPTALLCTSNRVTTPGLVLQHRIFEPLGTSEVGFYTRAQRDGKQLDVDASPCPTGHALHCIYPEVEVFVQLIHFGSDVRACDFSLWISLIDEFGCC